MIDSVDQLHIYIHVFLKDIEVSKVVGLHSHTEHMNIRLEVSLVLSNSKVRMCAFGSSVAHKSEWQLYWRLEREGIHTYRCAYQSRPNKTANCPEVGMLTNKMKQNIYLNSSYIYIFLVNLYF